MFEKKVRNAAEASLSANGTILDDSSAQILRLVISFYKDASGDEKVASAMSLELREKGVLKRKWATSDTAETHVTTWSKSDLLLGSQAEICDLILESVAYYTEVFAQSIKQARYYLDLEKSRG